MANAVTIQRQGKQWAVYVNGKLIEGGFFTREAAIIASAEYTTTRRDQRTREAK